MMKFLPNQGLSLFLCIFSVAVCLSSSFCTRPTRGKSQLKPKLDLTFSGNFSKPNVLIISADGLGFSDLSCYGSEIRTPNIDALANQGKLFTGFRSQGVDYQTQACLLTGRQPFEVGLGKAPIVPKGAMPAGPYAGYLLSDYPNLAQLFKEKGYNTWLIGKWHLGHLFNARPVQVGFENFFGLIGNYNAYFESLPEALMVSNNQIAKLPKQDFYLTDLFADSAIKYLNGSLAKKRAFFGIINFTAPHWPIQAPESIIQSYEKIYKSGVQNLALGKLSRLKSKKIIQANISNEIQLPNQKIVDYRKMAAYAAAVVKLDQAIGKVIMSLKEANQFDNTCIVFLSTSGAHPEKAINSIDFEEVFTPKKSNIEIGKLGSFQGYGPYWANYSNIPFSGASNSLKEGGLRAPLLVKDINSFKNKTVYGSYFAMDIFPYLLKISGINYPSQFKNKELNPLEPFSLDSLNREEYYGWELNGNKGFLWSGLKWTLSSDGKVELFDLNNDPLERFDLSSKELKRAKRMEQEWKDWAYRLGIYRP